ncbi:hypothetical protein [Roseateles aquatilis]|uniref:hypothetical protein n=1 Tax=Roseateles aquatilis TaxID=431061 RepID=UPI00113170BA|nr:hypothetical protein [Roseateles aquatilis]
MDTTGSPPTPIDEPTLRAWAASGKTLRAEAVAHGRVWHLWLLRADRSYRLTSPNGAPRMFRTLETLARRLLELNIVDLNVIHSPSTDRVAFRRTPIEPSQADDFDQAAWDAWFKEQILLSLRDKRPGTDYRQVWQETRDRIRSAGGRHVRPKKP